MRYPWCSAFSFGCTTSRTFGVVWYLIRFIVTYGNNHSYALAASTFVVAVRTTTAVNMLRGETRGLRHSLPENIVLKALWFTRSGLSSEYSCSARGLNSDDGRPYDGTTAVVAVILRPFIFRFHTNTIIAAGNDSRLNGKLLLIIPKKLWKRARCYTGVQRSTWTSECRFILDDFKHDACAYGGRTSFVGF